MSDTLAAFRAADFDWTTRLQGVWRDPPVDVAALHRNVRAGFAEKLDRMKQAADQGDHGSPLGWVLTGPGGSGKTHLLAAMRKEAASRGAGFVLVDMTDVRDFWETVLQGYLDSLQEKYLGGEFQHVVLLRNCIRKSGLGADAAEALRDLSGRKSADLATDVGRLLGALRKAHPREALGHGDVVRALLCLNSDDFGIANAGMAWLQGQPIEEQLRTDLRFQKEREDPRTIVGGLSWLMSLSGPTVVAFDQLDPIVHQFARPGDDSPENEGQLAARRIIEGICGGLAGLRDTTRSTLTVLSCVERTWDLLHGAVLKQDLDRFEEPIRLQRGTPKEVFEPLIAGRLGTAYKAASFAPPYPTWPFRLEAIAALTIETPREVLKLCEAHRKRCADAGAVSELAEFSAAGDEQSRLPPHRFAALDGRFARLRQEARPADLLDEKHEDERLAPLLQAGLCCLVREHELPDEVDAQVDTHCSGGSNTKPLHVRLRLIFHKEHSREEHYCARALLRTHHAAFNTRLKGATTQSGIDKALPFRHLTVVRRGGPPNGASVAALVTKFSEYGGKFYAPVDDELRTLWALARLLEQNDVDLNAWLRERRPATRLALCQAIVPSPLLGGSPTESPSPGSDPPDPAPTPGPSLPAVVSPPTTPTPDRAATPTELPLGSRILGAGKLGGGVGMPASLLSRHTMILGGSGSGKSVAVRRLVEEAALLGIPSVVIDCARDMALFDSDWPRPPESWREGDGDRARRFRANSEMVVWTPGRESGNSLLLRPLPDFTPLLDDVEELEEAVQMASEALAEVVAPGNSQKSKNKRGILTASLRFLAKNAPAASLEEYAELLSSLPADAGLGVKQEGQLAGEMADSLKVEMARNLLLRTTGTPLDPAVLFGDAGSQGKTRISVISLIGLPSDSMQRSFVNQLAMLLFSWIKKHPTPPAGRPLRGLLVVDEAKDFVPAQRKTECKESLVRLAAQARKYGLGLVFATQHPKDVETKVVGNCATHLYGLNNSPASLDTLRDLMAQKGGSGDDIPRLKAGEFYVHNADAGITTPVKIKVAMSLSLSPSSPLEDGEILDKARRSRGRLQ